MVLFRCKLQWSITILKLNENEFTHYNLLTCNISMHILYSVLYTFPEVLMGRTCLIRFFSWWSFLHFSWSCREKLNADNSLGLKDYILIYWSFNSLKWFTWNFYPCTLQQTGNENTQTYYSKVVVILIQPFNSLEWPRQNFSLQYLYNINQISDENKENYQFGNN